MASLQGNTIKDTYKSLLKVADNGELEAGLQEITDGDGNGTGVSLNTSGDVTATGTVSFDSLKDTDENITISKFVDEADGIANNDNDTSIPTSAAVKDYVDTNITAQDLDITDGTNVGAVDLDSQSLTFTGDAGVSATVAGQTVTFDSSALQSQINTNDTDITALQAADTTLQNNINSEESARIAADSTLQSNINAEESARISADSGLQTQINNNDSDITALQTADTTLQNNINAEESARIAADNTLQSNITAEATTRGNADTALQTNINNEEAARIAADTTLQNNINTEANTRASADTSLQNQIDANDGDISALDGRLTTAEGNITSNDTDISNLDSRLTTAEGNITSNDTDISNLQSGKQDISEKNQANGYAPLDAGAKIPIANIPDSVLGQVEYQGTYNASTDTPTLPAASTVKGDYYVVSVAGTYETISYSVGDWIISNGTAWEKVDNTDAVTTVFGRLGAVVANESDYSSFYPLISDLNTTNSNVSGLDGRLTTAEGDITAIETKTDFITVTQAVNLDTIESDTATNNAKISFDSASSSKLAGIEAGAEVNTVDSVNGATGVVVLSTSDLNDVSATAPTDNQVLVFDVALGVYVPETLSPAAPVDSVNGQTGVVVLDADDIDDTTTTNKFTTQTDIDKLAGIEAGAEVNNIDGSGGANYVTKWSDANTITVASIFDNGTSIGVGTINTPSWAKLGINGACLTDGNVSITPGSAIALNHYFNSGTVTDKAIEAGYAGGIFLNNTDGSMRFRSSSSSVAADADVTMSERIRILASGGITFNGDTAAANALDDYEEGTWTMGIAFGGNSVDAAYNDNTGKYTKIGNQVTVSGILGLSSKGSSTGVATITGLPFTVFNNNANYSAVTLRMNIVTFADYPMGFANPGQTTISLQELTNAGVVTSLDNSNFANNSSLIFSLTYFVS